MDIAELGFRVDTTGLERADKSLRGLDQNSRNVDNSLAAMFNRLRGLGAVIAGLGIGVAVREFISLSDAYKGMNALLGVATTGTEEFRIAQQGLYEIASRSRAPLQDVFSLYSNVAPSLREMGFAQNEILKSTELVSKALKIGGGEAQGHANALRQLTQALGSGVLRGDEFNSIMENGRGLAVQLAAGLDVPIGALRGMAEQGELTAEVVINALLKQEQAIEGSFANLPIKSGEAWTLVKNEALKAVGEIDQELGIAETWAEALVSVANGIGSFATIALGHIRDLATDWAFFKDDLQFSDDRSYRVLRDIGEAIDQIGEYLQPVTDYLDEFLTAVGLVVGTRAGIALVAGALTLVGTAIVGIGKALLANPIALAITGIAFAAQVIYDNWDGIVEWFSDLWARVKTEFDLFLFNTISWVADFVASGLNAGRDFVEGMVEGVTNAASGAWEATKNLATGAVDAVKGALDSHSPSRVMMQVGNDFGEGFAIGIDQSTGKVVIAAQKMSEESVKAFNNISEGLYKQRLALIEGDEALERYELGLKGITDGAQDYVIAERAAIAALKEKAAVQDRISRQQEQTAKDLAIHNVYLLEGAEAAKAYALELEGWEPAAAKAEIATQSLIRLQQDFKQALIDSIANADSFKDVFSDMGDWILDWLKQLIAEFVANKVMLYVGADITSAMSQVQNLIGGLGSGNVSLDPNFVGPIQPDAGAGAVIGKAIGAGFVGYALSEATDIGNSTGAGFGAAAGYALGAKLGALGGPWGAVIGGVIGSAFASKAKVVGSGIEIAYSNSSGVMGRAYEEYQKVRALWQGASTWRIYSELDAEVRKALDDHFTGLTETIIDGARTLGAEGAKGILEGFETATASLGSEAELGDWLAETTVAAYRYAMDQIAPEIQEAIINGLTLPFDSVDLAGYDAALQGITDQMEANRAQVDELRSAYANGDITMLEYSRGLRDLNAEYASLEATMENAGLSAEELEERWAEVAHTAAVIMPAFERLGLVVGDTFGALVLSSQDLVDALGGTEAAMDFLQVVLDQTLGPIAQLGLQIDTIGLSVTQLNDDLVIFGQSTNLSSEEILAHIQRLQELQAANVALSPAQQAELETLLALYPATVAYEQALAQMNEYVETGADILRNFGVSVDTTNEATRKVIQGFIDMAGGMEEFTQKMGSVYEWLYTEEERKNNQLAESAARLQEWNDSLNLTDEQINAIGDSYIDTAEEARAYLDTLERGSEEYVRAVLALHDVQDAIMLLEEAGLTIEEVFAMLPEETRDIWLAAYGYTIDGMGNIVKVIDEGISESVGLMGQFVDATEEQVAQVGQGLSAMAGALKTSTEESYANHSRMVEDNAKVVNDSAGLISTATESFNQSLTSMGETISAVTSLIIASAEGVGTGLDAMNQRMVESDMIFKTSSESISIAAAAASQIMSESAATINAKSQEIGASYAYSGEMMINGASVVHAAANDANASMTGMAATMSSGAAAIGSASGVAGGAMSSFAGAMQSVAGAASQAASIAAAGASSASSSARAADSFAKSALSSANTASSALSAAVSAAQSASRAANDASIASRSASDASRQASSTAASVASLGLNGSFASGLDYVPFDGFRAELHQGEMILPANVANFFRDAGVPVAPANAPQKSSNESTTELKAIRQELAKLREENKSLRQETTRAFGALIGETQRQTGKLGDIETSNDRMMRKVGNA